MEILFRETERLLDLSEDLMMQVQKIREEIASRLKDLENMTAETIETGNIISKSPCLTCTFPSIVPAFPW